MIKNGPKSKASHRTAGDKSETDAGSQQNEEARQLRRPFRWCILLGLVTFPLIWVGGLVTTTDAGMAVPDWPNTYGYNLFLYPYSTWFFGPWDLFIEHGHRLLGSLAGLVAICLVVSSFRNTSGKPIRVAAVVALLLVILQGVLGGIRVLESERFLAKVHGCVGPLFFAYVASLAMVIHLRRKQISITNGNESSKSNRSADAGTKALVPQSTVGMKWLAPILAGTSFLQLVLGASLRHIDEAASFLFFRDLVFAHLLIAGCVLVLSLVTIWFSFRSKQQGVRRISWMLGFMVCCQIVLGIATWITKYHLPFAGLSWFANYIVLDKSMLQTLIVTAHVAVGSLILMLSSVLATLALSSSTAEKQLRSQVSVGNQVVESGV